MFERFTANAHECMELAQAEARDFGHDYIGTEHLLIALARQPHTLATQILNELGATAADLRQDALRIVGPAPDRREIDGEALASIGIDLDEVRRRVEETFGPGALDRRWQQPGEDLARARKLRRLLGNLLRRERDRGRLFTPLTPRTKKALELGLRAAIGRGDGFIATEHILLGIARVEDGVGARMLARHGITTVQLQTAIDQRRRAA